MKHTPLGSLFAERVPSLNPSQFPNEEFELWSIPAYDAGKPGKAVGRAIGSAKQIVQPNDVLLSRIVPHIRRAWVVAQPEQKRRQIASGEWIVFRSDDIAPEYLRHFLMSEEFHRQFMKTVAGVGGSLLRARPERVREIKAPLPALDEQRRIAAILDQADDLRRKRRAALEVLKRFPTAILNSGANARRADTRQYTLGELCSVIRDGTHKTPDYVEAGVPFVTVKNIVSGTLDLSSTKFISPEEHLELTKRICPQKGDILVSKDGTIGVPCPILSDADFSIFVSVALLRPKPDLINQTFLVSQLKSQDVQKQIIERSKGIAIRHLHLEDFRALRIDVPHLADQLAFTARVAETDKLKIVHRRQLRGLNSLFASLQHRAFEGRL